MPERGAGRRRVRPGRQRVVAGRKHALEPRLASPRQGAQHGEEPGRACLPPRLGLRLDPRRVRAERGEKPEVAPGARRPAALHRLARQDEGGHGLAGRDMRVDPGQARERVLKRADLSGGGGKPGDALAEQRLPGRVAQFEEDPQRLAPVPEDRRFRRLRHGGPLLAAQHRGEIANGGFRNLDLVLPPLTRQEEGKYLPFREEPAPQGAPKNVVDRLPGPFPQLRLAGPLRLDEVEYSCHFLRGGRSSVVKSVKHMGAVIRWSLRRHQRIDPQPTGP